MPPASLPAFAAIRPGPRNEKTRISRVARRLRGRSRERPRRARRGSSRSADTGRTSAGCSNGRHRSDEDSLSRPRRRGTCAASRAAARSPARRRRVTTPSTRWSLVDDGHDGEVEVGHQPGDLFEIRFDRTLWRRSGDVSHRGLGVGAQQVGQLDRALADGGAEVHDEDPGERVGGCRSSGAIRSIASSRGRLRVEADEIGAHQSARSRRVVAEQERAPAAAGRRAAATRSPRGAPRRDR